MSCIAEENYLYIDLYGIKNAKSKLNRSIEEAKEQRDNITRAIESLQVPDGVLRRYGDELISVKNSISNGIDELLRIILHIDYVVRRFEEVDDEFAKRFKAVGYEMRELLGLDRKNGSFGDLIAGLVSIVSQGTKALKHIVLNEGKELANSIKDWFDDSKVVLDKILKTMLDATTLVRAVMAIAPCSAVPSTWPTLNADLAEGASNIVDSGRKFYDYVKDNGEEWLDDAIDTGEDILEDAAKVAINVGSYALDNSYEASNYIAPYTRTWMYIYKHISPLYWAFLFSTQQGCFSEAFDIGGFKRDENGIYHAKQSGSLQSWEYAGYNNLYDGVFNCATNMERTNFPFTYNGKEYILWAWKGDYLNLGAGAEMGIYTRAVVDDTPTAHWLVDQDLAMPMTLKLEYKGEEIINYNPKEDDPKGESINKWWVTGFNPKYQDAKPGELMATYTVDFTGNEEIFNKFYETWNGVYDSSGNIWSFDKMNNTATLCFKEGESSK